MNWARVLLPNSGDDDCDIFKYAQYKKYRWDSIDFQIDDVGEVEELS